MTAQVKPNQGDFAFEAVKETRSINGVLFPKEIDTSKMIVTGPPGSGKSTILKAIGGWPEEGYINLAIKGWWKSPTLSYRPREIHFGLPFMGHPDAVPVYQAHTLDDADYLELDLFRITLPPPSGNIFSADFRSRFVFEFIIPPPEVTFARRQQRAIAGTHHVDENISIEQVRAESVFYTELALFLHQSGFAVHIRDGDIPKRIVRTSEAPIMTSQKELTLRFDQLRLRQRILNRSWSSRGNQQLLELFVEMIPEVIDVERCSIFIDDTKSDMVWLKCGTGMKEGDIEIDKASSVVGQVIATGEYMVRENMDHTPGPHREIDARTGFVTRNQLCVPIESLTGERAAGAILALNKRHGKPFTEEDRIFLEKVARHLETAIESFYLRQEMMDFSELLAHRAKIIQWSLYGFGILFVLLAAQSIFIARLLDLD